MPRHAMASQRPTRWRATNYESLCNTIPSKKGSVTRVESLPRCKVVRNKQPLDVTAAAYSCQVFQILECSPSPLHPVTPSTPQLSSLAPPNQTCPCLRCKHKPKTIRSRVTSDHRNNGDSTIISNASTSRVQPLPAAPGDALHSTTLQPGASPQNVITSLTCPIISCLTNPCFRGQEKPQHEALRDTRKDSRVKGT